MLEQLAELRRLEKEATPAPWTDDRSAVLANGGDEIADAFAACPQGALNAQLIAAMRNALPELLRCAEENAKLRKAIEDLLWAHDVEGDDGAGDRARALLGKGEL